MELITPNWSVLPRVRAVSSLRIGGVSAAPYASLNLGDHVNDQPSHVAQNRAVLAAAAALPGPVCWLDQVHGISVARGTALGRRPKADASVTTTPGEVLAILTADCLPVLLARRDGQAVGAVHAGWRSLAGGVIENTLAALDGPGDQFVAWLGPAIGPSAFEVGADVRDAFLSYDAQAASAFVAKPNGRWFADLYQLATQRLNALGVRAIGGGQWCTYSDPERFFSYRRDGQCGRMATLVWIEP